MLINPNAVEKLKIVMADSGPQYGYYTTHRERNGFAQMFINESGKLLDQKAESVIKHVVECYTKEEMTYEQYIEAIEQVSREEEARGATTGGEYARNRTFNFAQKALEATQSQTHELSLMDAKKQYEIERRKSEQSINAVVLQHIANIETIAQQHDTEIRETAQKQKEELILNQDAIVEQTKTDIDHIILKELQIEKSRMEREIYELEDVRPAREAARAATKLVEDREKEQRTHKRLKSGLVLLAVAVFIAIIVILTFFPSLKAIAVILLLGFGLIIITVSLRKSGITEGKIAKDKQEIASFKTKSGDYASLNEEDRCALLTQRIF